MMSDKQTAILAGGCFWCTEAVFRDVIGVSEVESGYIGGAMPDPDYRSVCSGTTGHAEAIKVEFDPAEISYAEILDVFMGTHAAAAASRAHYVLPTTTFAEQEGTFTNHENRVQRFWPGLEAPGASRPAWLILGALLAERTGTPPNTRPEAAFESIPAFGGLTYETVGTQGAVTGSSATLTAGAAGD